MAECLSEVKKDLGPEAVILRTRTLRAGGVLGIASKPLVEITASAAMPETNAVSLEQRRRRARAAAGEDFSPSLSPAQPPRDPERDAAIATLDRLAKPTDPTDPTDPTEPRSMPAPRRVAPPRPTTPVEVAPPAPTQRPATPTTYPTTYPTPGPARLQPTTVTLQPQGPDAQAALEAELHSIRRLVGQVLQTTRSTAVHLTKNARDAALTTGGLPDALFNYYTGMLDNAVPADIADDIATQARTELSPAELADPQIVRQTLLRALAERIRTAPSIKMPRTGEPARAVAFVGPTGVGKTTTIAKLAATLKLRHGRRVGLITADTYRIAAVEQLRTYAGIIGLPVKVALTPAEMAQARDSFADCDLILIDTAGRSPGDETRLGELAGFLEAAAPDETHLVLAASSANRALARAADRFGCLGPDRLLLTKLDETEGLGVIIAACEQTKLPIAYVSTGQEVPDDFEPANADRLARLALEGEGAS